MEKKRGIQEGVLLWDFSCNLALIQPASVLSELPPCSAGDFV